MSHARIRIAAVLVLLAAGASCSDDDSADPTTTAPPSTTRAPDTTETTPATTTTEIATLATTGATQPPPTDPKLFEGPVEAFYTVPDPLPAGEPGTLLRYQPTEAAVAPFEPDSSLFVLETADVTLWMFSDPVALLASPPGDELVPDRQVGGSVDELVAWLVGHPELDTSAPQPVTIGGLDGDQVDVAVTPGSTSTSPGRAGGGVRRRAGVARPELVCGAGSQQPCFPPDPAGDARGRHRGDLPLSA